MRRIDIAPMPPERFGSIIEPEQYVGFASTMARFSSLLAGRTLWNLNSTAQGGGVAEMLAPLLGYLVGAGMDARWAVIEADDDFFKTTKRIHNLLHGDPGDGEGLGEDDRSTYERALRASLDGLNTDMRPGDVVILHDPQTVGLAPALRRAGARVIWSCHVGIDEPNDDARAAWDFLRPYVGDTEIRLFTRRSYAWQGLDAKRLAIVPPCIDVFSPKNQMLDPGVGSAILRATGIVDKGSGHDAAFVRHDGSRGRVSRPTRMVPDRPLPVGAPIVAQVSRWDRLKDPTGVLQGFAHHVPHASGAHLVLAGPAVGSVSDDPEEADTLRHVREVWERLPEPARGHVRLACLPMEDLEENAAIVNALQRRADVVVQKSLAEGFGLTVAEAMWKGRAVVASRVGGIQDQIDDGNSGLLVDPQDPASFGRAVTRVLEDREMAARLGQRAHDRVRDEFLLPRYLVRLSRVVERVLRDPFATALRSTHRRSAEVGGR